MRVELSLVMAFVLLSGCAAYQLPPEESPPTSTEPTTTITEVADTTENCSVFEIPPTPVSSTDEKATYPDKPTHLDRSSSIKYATHFEKAYAYNSKYSPRWETIGVSISGVSSMQIVGGYKVTISYVEVELDSKTIEADDGWSVTYIVTESHVKRGQGISGSPPQNSEKLHTILCNER